MTVDPERIHARAIEMFEAALRVLDREPLPVTPGTMLVEGVERGQAAVLTSALLESFGRIYLLRLGVAGETIETSLRNARVMAGPAVLDSMASSIARHVLERLTKGTDR